jgi:hypothetical protein
MADSRIRTVCIELQRAGPPHNQLLSPLTRYLATTREAETGELSVPYEHVQMLRKLKGLRVTPAPRDAPASVERQLALTELSRDMSRLLVSIPGLAGQLASRDCKNELIHLQIMTSAAELALLPFELSGTVESHGEQPGSYLTLAARPRVSLTRRVKSVSEQCVAWPVTPKILFVSANPGNPVPYDEHLDALLRALQPWLPPLLGPGKRETTPKRETQYREALDLQLTVLEHADIDRITRLCTENDFTHVHVLAHGAVDAASPGKHVGVLLHDPSEPSQGHVVGGEQFASALRRAGGRGMPSVVSVAACDSGYVNEVMYTGTSFLHDLHRSGVPFVIGSQFPLSKPGSVDLCEKLYSGLLGGEDPRELLAELRLRLHSRYAAYNHDWASLVVYAVFPDDFARQLEEVRYRQGRRASNVALAHLDQTVVERSGESRDPADAAAGELIDEVINRTKQAIDRLPINGRFRVEGLGLIAAHEKRIAHALYRIGEHERSLRYLRRARTDYTRAFEQGARFQGDEALTLAPLHWALTQEISLTLVLGLQQDSARPVMDRIATARTVATQDLDVGSRDAEVWAITSLLELELLAAWMNPNEQVAHIASMLYYTERLLRSRENADAVYSTDYQLRRYTSWWWTEAFVTALAKPPESTSVPAVPAAIDRRPVQEGLSAAVARVAAQMREYLEVNHTSIARKR